MSIYIYGYKTPTTQIDGTVGPDALRNPDTDRLFTVTYPTTAKRHEINKIFLALGRVVASAQGDIAVTHDSNMGTTETVTVAARDPHDIAALMNFIETKPTVARARWIVVQPPRPPAKPSFDIFGRAKKAEYV